MIKLIEQNLDMLQELCKRYGVRNLELFGSAASGQPDLKVKDVDFLVDFLPVKGMNIADQYFGLLEELKRLFGCPIDLVMKRALKNPYFIESVERRKALLYAA